LIACSEPWFRVVERRDATEDYLRTSRFWKEKLVDTWTPKKALTFGRLIAQNAHHPLDVVMALKFFRDQSWIWQFEGADPPVRLLQLVLEPTERRAAERQNTDRRSAHLTA
jgi:cyclopropane fatty-acyl-phospholipid synthase-like methyltransferase